MSSATCHRLIHTNIAFQNLQLDDAEINDWAVRSFVGGYPPSIRHVPELRPIHLNDLSSEVRHTDRVLYAKICRGPGRHLNVFAGIEDEDGTCCLLTAYNIELTTPPKQVFPRGALVALKEPYYRCIKNEPYLTIRIDHLSDLVMLGAHDPLIPQDSPF
jgi:hypothetical protein